MKHKSIKAYLQRSFIRSMAFITIAFCMSNTNCQVKSTKKEQIEKEVHDFLFQKKNDYPQLAPHVEKDKSLEYIPYKVGTIMAYKRYYRGIHISDLITGKEFDGSVGGGGNSEIRDIFVLDEEKRLVVADVIYAGGNDYYVLYDMTKGEEVGSFFTPPGVIFPFNGHILFCEFMDNHNVKWYFTDPYFENKTTNALTDELNQKQISFMEAKNINMKYHMLIGDIDDDITGIDHLPVAVTWNEDLTKARSIPLIRQHIHEGQYTDEIFFSPFGDWLIWEVNRDYVINDLEQMATSEVYFYKISEDDDEVVLFPPIYGGIVAAVRGYYRSTDMSGKFKNEKHYGECFIIDNPDLFEKYRLIYPFKELDMAYNKAYKEYPYDIAYPDEYRYHLFFLHDSIRIVYKSPEPVFYSTQSPSGEYILAQDWNHELTLFTPDANTKELQKIATWIPDSNDWLHKVVFSPDEESFFVIRKKSSDLVQYDVKGNILHHYIIDSIYENLTSITTTEKNETLVTTGRGYILVFKEGSPKPVEIYNMDENLYTPTCVNTSPDGEFILTGDDFSYVLIINRTNKNSIKFSAGSSEIYEIGMTRDNDYITLRKWMDKNYITLYTPEGHFITTIKNGGEAPLNQTDIISLLRKSLEAKNIEKYFITQSEDIWKLAASPTSENLAYLDSKGYIHLINEESKELITIDWNGVFENIAYSPDGKYLAATTREMAVCLFNMKGECVNRLYGLHLRATKLNFSPDGEKLYTSSYRETATFDLKKGIVEHKDHKQLGFDYTLDNSKVLRQNNDPMYGCLVDINTGKQLARFDGMDELSESEAVFINLDNVDRVSHIEKNDVEFGCLSPTGKYCAIIDENTKFYVYDATGTILLMDKTNTYVNYLASFSNDERYVAYHCYKGYVSDNEFKYGLQIKVVDLQKKEMLLELEGINFAFSPDSKYIYVYDDGNIEKYPLNGKAKATRILRTDQFTGVTAYNNNIKFYKEYEETLKDAFIYKNELIIAFDYSIKKVYKYLYPQYILLDSLEIRGAELFPFNKNGDFISYDYDDTLRHWNTNPFILEKNFFLENLDDICYNENTNQFVYAQLNSWNEDMAIFSSENEHDNTWIKKNYPTPRYTLPVSSCKNIPGYIASLEEETFCHISEKDFSKTWESPKQPGLINTLACGNESIVYIGGNIDDGWFNGYLTVWDMEKKVQTAEYRIFSERIKKIEVTEKPGLILLQSDEWVILFNSITGDIERTFSVGTNEILGMHYSGDGMLVIFCSKALVVYNIFE
ncbi:MAG: WD40 repeat domain-containing protein [Bacteroidales bacterium]|nr:WD40 repeat domain-containing protein [Bacteroidales bacterium]